MKSLNHYIFESDNNIIDNFIILCKYADLFNQIEQQWHDYNKQTPTSKAIKEETDKMFAICNKFIRANNNLSDFDPKGLFKAEADWMEESELRGKKLATVIRKTSEWKDFYKSFKKFRNNKINLLTLDGSLQLMMELFIQHSVDFVEDIQA